MNKNGKPRRYDWETEKRYERRVWFVEKYVKVIANGNRKNEKSGTEAIRLANIWVNMILLHCRYPEKLEKKIYENLKRMEKRGGK